MPNIISAQHQKAAKNNLKDPSLFTVFKLSRGLKIKPSAFIAEVEHLL